MAKQQAIDSANPGSTQASQLPGAPAAELISLTQRTDALCRGLCLVLEHHNASARVLAGLNEQVHGYLDSSDCEKSWLKRCKHLLTYPLAKYLRNDPPPAPDAVFAPAGELRAWMKVRLLVFSRKNTHLWYSWFQAKRSTLPLSASIIEATYDDHFATLSKEDNGDDGTIDAIFADKTFMSVLERVREKFNRNYASLPAFDKMSASTSACFEQSRGKGGQNGELTRLSGVSDSNIGELVSMVWTPAGYCSGERRMNTVFEVRRPFGSDRWMTLREHLLARDPNAPISCTIQAVLEPNKVRVISKGEALPYYSCRPIQKALHGSMREMPPFRLIGRPFCPTDMIDLAAKARADWEWFSVDYSAATDGLSWKYSGRIFRYLMQDLPPLEYATAMSVLGPHRLHYPVQGGKPVFRGLQRNGQLMGSILSFPILCLANLGVYLLTTQPSHRGWSHEERLNHVLINGDDMVYAAHPALWPVHVDNGKKVGLLMSVGKAYRHPVYANVNSTSVHYDLRQMPVGLPRRDLRWEPTPYQINYLNAGLFFGQHKVQERVELKEEADQDESSANGPQALELARAHLGQDPSKGLVVNLPCVLSGSLPGAQSALLKKFLNTHHDEIARETFAVIRKRGRYVHHTRNLFLPLCAGGMGVLAPVGWTFKVTESDRHVAKSLYELPYARTGQLPLPQGYPLSDVDQLVDCPWLKPKDDQLDFPEFKSCGSKLSKSKTLLGWVCYSPTYALCGIQETAPSLSDKGMPWEDQVANYARSELDQMIDWFYANVQPIGTYDRPERLPRAGLSVLQSQWQSLLLA